MPSRNKTAGVNVSESEEANVFCDRCGGELTAGVNYCARCGKPAGGASPMMPAKGRIAGHVRMLGIFWIGISIFRLLPGLFIFTVFPHAMPFLPPDVPPFVFGLIRMVGVFLAGAAVIGIVAGWGLLERRPWARMLAIVLGCLNLVDMPFGTALGIYTLWVLLPTKSEEEYRTVSQAQ
jgi:hypothetical protein